MTTALQETPVATAAWSDASAASPYVQRVMEEVERDVTPRQETPQSLAPATRRTVRLFAFD